MKMYTLKECQDIIEMQITRIILPESPVRLYEPIRYVLNSLGKRIRPSLTLLACNLFSDLIDKALNPALAIEIFHNFTLMHDDIMDNSDMRRGHPTVHMKWNDNTAILSGDTMMIKAYEYLSYCSADILPTVLKVFNETAIGVCEGQQFDMDFETSQEVTVEDYLKMIELKTSVLIAASLQIGAICGGAENEDSVHLYQFGKNLGIAFQLQDDMLDVYADQKIFGKAIGNDIVANKKTFLLINAVNLAKGETLKDLKKLITEKCFTNKEKIGGITEIYNRLKIKELTENKIKVYFNNAFVSLNQVSVKKEKKVFLEEFATQLLEREK